MQAQMTCISTKGQAVIPVSIRKQLGLSSGSRLVVLTDGENVLMKPVDSPSEDSFEELVEKSHSLPNDEEDVMGDIALAIARKRDDSDY